MGEKTRLAERGDTIGDWIGEYDCMGESLEEMLTLIVER